MEILLNPRIANVSWCLFACLPASCSHIFVQSGLNSAFHWTLHPHCLLDPPVVDGFTVWAWMITCSTTCTRARWIKTINPSHGLLLCRLHTGPLQRAPYTMSERYSISQGKSHSLELCCTTILMVSTAWYPGDVSKGYAYSKVSAYQHMHQYLTYQYLILGTLTQSQINVNYSLITGSDAKGKSEAVCLISNTW